MWGSAWIDIYWNSIWLRARSHMTSYYTWGSVKHTTWFWRCVGRPLNTFFWALTISWSWLLACVWSGPYVAMWDSTSQSHPWRMALAELPTHWGQQLILQPISVLLFQSWCRSRLTLLPIVFLLGSLLNTQVPIKHKLTVSESSIEHSSDWKKKELARNVCLLQPFGSIFRDIHVHWVS